jgi:uncharacterized protein YydD (DUF2326 family)
MLDLAARFNSKSEDCMVLIDMASQRLSINTRVLVDGSQFLIFKCDKHGDLATHLGNQVALRDGRVCEVTETTPLYSGEDLAFYRCSVQEVPKYAQMSELWQRSP